MSTDHVLHVSIVTPASVAFEGDALAVSVPGSKSPFQVLYNHAPIISSLDIGVLKIEAPSNAVTYYAAREGFVEVLKNTVSIVVQELQLGSEIDASKAASEIEQKRLEWNAAHGRSARESKLRELHWAEARYRAARLQNGE